LPLTLVMNAVSHPQCIAIALLDNTRLHETIAADKNNDGARYVGHYVVVCGCSSQPQHLASAREQDGETESANDREDRSLVLKNPGQDSSPTMYVLPSRFERSWRASGTDDDIVFLIRQ